MSNRWMRYALHWRTALLVWTGMLAVLIAAKLAPGVIIPVSSAIVAMVGVGAGKAVAEHLSGAAALKATQEALEHHDP